MATACFSKHFGAACFAVNGLKNSENSEKYKNGSTCSLSSTWAHVGFSMFSAFSGLFDRKTSNPFKEEDGR